MQQQISQSKRYLREGFPSTLPTAFLKSQRCSLQIGLRIAWWARSPLTDGQLSCGTHTTLNGSHCIQLTWIRCSFSAPLWATSFSLILNLFKIFNQNKIRKKKNVFYPSSGLRIDSKLLAVTSVDSRYPERRQEQALANRPHTLNQGRLHMELGEIPLGFLLPTQPCPLPAYFHLIRERP